MARTPVDAEDVYARIRAVIREIPRGRVASYGQIAALAGIPGHARQVGYALRTLPDDSDVPWQRVINGRGEVSRRAGEDLVGPGQGFQRHLLLEEGVVFDSAGRVDLERFGWDPVVHLRARSAFSAAREVAVLKDRLAALGSPARAIREKGYLKSDLDFLGVDVPTVRREARGWLRSHPEATRAQLVALGRAAWRGRVFELRTLALELLVARSALLATEDLALCEWMLRRAGTWAHVDVIAPELVGALLARDRAVLRALDRWRSDADFWLRRAALLALLPSLRRDATHWRRFARDATALLGEREFFVRKAIGWVLREVAKRDPDAVAAFVAAHLDAMSGTTFREAVRRLPAKERAALLSQRSAPQEPQRSAPALRPADRGAAGAGRAAGRRPRGRSR